MRSPGHHPSMALSADVQTYAPMPHAAHTRSRQVDVYAYAAGGG